MKSVFNKPLTTSSISLLNASECRKEIATPEFYIQYKLNGQDCLLPGFSCCRIKLTENTLIFNGSRDFESIGIIVVKADQHSITNKKYTLGQDPSQSATYKNSSFVNDTYNTDSVHTGTIEIVSIDRNKNIITGKFSFDAYNAVRKKTVHITAGRFRLKYF